jgi:hypothetical protein
MRLAAKKAEKERRDEEERLRRERVERLLELAEDHRKAETIRALVGSVERARAAEDQFSKWRDWALSVAAEIDPIHSISFRP